MSAPSPASLTFALAQLNPVVGDIAGNVAALQTVRKRAAGQGVDLLVTTELYLCGYPAEDLVLKPGFQRSCRRAAEDLALATADGGPAILLGLPWVMDGCLLNAMLLLERGRIAAVIGKRSLPNYGPFDEKRIFTPATGTAQPVMFRGVELGILICEDLWTAELAAQLREQGAQFLIVPNASPYETVKHAARQAVARQRVAETGLPVAYVNQIGGQDELVFDGGSFALDAAGQCAAQALAWREDLLILRWQTGRLTADEPVPDTAIEGAPASTYNALLLGLRDYVLKNKFTGVLLGLSGGIDSALVAMLAVDALGAPNVWCVMMPSPYTSNDSLIDAAQLASALGCRLDTVPIMPMMQAAGTILDALFAGSVADVTEENIQARSRGLLLMALSNKFGRLVLATGNKSEMAVGYSTLYGDLCGGFAPLKDVYKTDVYAASRWRNEHKPATALGPDGACVPERIFTKAPTAELRPGQTDQDSLPPYDVLDAVLTGLIEEDQSVGELVAQGHDRAMVERIAGLLASAEYKRRQAPPGPKITSRHLVKDRRYPITNGYRDKA